MKSIHSKILLMSLVGLVTVGCGPRSEPVPTRPSAVNVSLGKLEPWRGSAPRNGEWEPQIRLALSLGDEGRHEQAAVLLEDLAGQVRSGRQEMEQALWLAAANERLKAGQPLAANRNIEAYLRSSDRWQVASLPEEGRMLLAIHEVVTGLERTSSTRDLLSSL